MKVQNEKLTIHKKKKSNYKEKRSNKIKNDLDDPKQAREDIKEIQYINVNP